MGPHRALLLLLASACTLSVGASAQTKTAFDPARDLAGFEAARASEYKDLYPLDKYSEMLGDELDKAALEKVQAQWTAESGAIQKHLDEVRTNPVEGVRWLLTERMARHPFFSKVALTVDASTPPFLIFVQKPALDDPEYAPAVVSVFAPFLVKVAAVFDARIAKPSGAARRADSPWTPVAILASSGDLQNYDRLSRNAGGFTTGARYDGDLDMVVGFVNSFDKPKAALDTVHPILRETLMSLLLAHVIPPADDVPSLWLQEGLASALAYPRGGRMDALDKPEPRAADLKRLVEICHDANARPGLLFPVANLVSMSSWYEIRRAAFGDQVQPAAKLTALSVSFLSQSALWMHFLLVPENGKHRASFQQYLRLALSGTSGADALSLSFPGTKLADLDREFWAWVYDEHKRVFPEVEVDRNDLTNLFAKPGAAVDEIAARARASVPTTPPEPPFVPATLAISENDVESRHGMALVQARSGDLEGAHAALEALAKTGPAVPEDGRIARDIARTAAAIRLRDTCLAVMAQKGQRLNFEKGGKKITLAVAKVEGGEVVFAENKQQKSLPLVAIDPAEIARLTEKKELQGDAPPWARAWLLLLVGDGRWDKVLKVDSDAARDMREDGNVWYRDRLRAGQAALAIEGMSKQSLPKSRAEAEPILATITELISKHGTAACVLFKKSGLQRLARASLDTMSAEVPAGEIVRGKITPGQDGVVTLVYDFDDVAEALDFQLQKGYLAAWRKAFTALTIGEDRSTIKVKGGDLVARGGAVWRLPVGFAVPLSVIVEYIYPRAEGEMHPPPHFALMLCDDGQESYATVQAQGGIHVRDRNTGRSADAASSVQQFFYDRDYRLEAINDGAKVTAHLDGELVATAQAVPNSKGGIGLFVHTETDVVIHRITVTGKLDPDSVTALRRVWADRKLAEIGF